MASWRGAQRWLTLGAAVACAVVLVAVAGSGRVQLGRSGAALASTSVRQQISAEVRDVLRHAQGAGAPCTARAALCAPALPRADPPVPPARRPMLPEHLLPKQVLAERDMKKGAWRGLGDKVVREFDSVFSAHKQQGKRMKPNAHHAPKVSLLCATRCAVPRPRMLGWSRALTWVGLWRVRHARAGCKARKGQGRLPPEDGTREQGWLRAGVGA